MSEDSQFPTIAQDLPEAGKYASLWATRDAQRIRERKIFWVLMEMNIRMGINRKLWLSSMVYNSMQSFVKFKANFHHVFIRVWKDPTKTWNELPYLETDDVIFAVLESWSPEWRTPVGSTVEAENFSVQRKKEEVKVWMA